MAGLVSGAAPHDAVAAELRRWAAEPFDQARSNCGLAVLRYVGRVLGDERAGKLRRQLGGARVFIKLMRDPPAFRSASETAMRALDCPTTDAPLRGDVGLIELLTGLTAALCLGGAGAGKFMWAARGDAEVVIQPAKPLMAWRVQCPRP